MRLAVVVESDTSIALQAEGEIAAAGAACRFLEQECLRHLRLKREALFKRMVEARSGSVDVHSMPRRGVFSAFLPASEPPPVAQPVTR